MASCCWAPCDARSCCKSDSLMPSRGFTRSRPGTVLVGAPWRTPVNVNARTSTGITDHGPRTTDHGLRDRLEFFIVVTRSFIFSPAARPRSWRNGTPLSLPFATGVPFSDLTATHAALRERKASEYQGLWQRILVGCFPELSRGAGSRCSLNCVGSVLFWDGCMRVWSAGVRYGAVLVRAMCFRHC